MLTTKPSVVEITKGKVKTEIEVRLKTNELVEEVPERVPELAVLIDAIMVEHPEWEAHEVATDLEQGLIFGKYDSNKHFRHDDLYAHVMAVWDQSGEPKKIVEGDLEP